MTTMVMKIDDNGDNDENHGDNCNSGNDDDKYRGGDGR